MLASDEGEGEWEGVEVSDFPNGEKGIREGFPLDLARIL
jgi:hypothetical protein